MLTSVNLKSEIRNLKSLRCVLFDAVGTLIRAEPSVTETYHAAGRRFGSKRDAAEIARRFRAAMTARQMAIQTAADALGGASTDHDRERELWRGIVSEIFDDVPQAGSELFEILWLHFARPTNWRLYDDAAEAWQALQQQGFLVGVASNFDDRLPEICRGLPPLDDCLRLFWSARIGHFKPSPQFFRRVEAELQLAPREILLVGDDYVNDIVGAQRAGWSAVYLDRSGEAKFPGAVGTLRQVPELLAP
jgi:putative hydrolase of the HAD superfamily